MDEVRDPVCGMKLDPNTSPYMMAHEGQTYHFCSTACRDMFEASPEKYLASSNATYTKSMGFPAPSRGFATSGGAEFEPPSAVDTARRAERRVKK